ncbi:unnamed protein product [Brassica oleracea var. botrytis]
MLWPHLHAIANHFPIDHPSFHYSNSSTLNSRDLLGCAPEKFNIHRKQKLTSASAGEVCGHGGLASKFCRGGCSDVLFQAPRVWRIRSNSADCY